MLRSTGKWPERKKGVIPITNNCKSFWKNVWNDDLSSAEAKNLKAIADALAKLSKISLALH